MQDNKDIKDEEVINKEEDNEKKSNEELEEKDLEKNENEDLEDEKEKEILALKDSLLRKAAEFDNFRKRSEKEKSAMFDLGSKSVIEKILPVIDNFERGLLNEPSTEEAKAFYDGMKMIYNQFMKGLEEIGVTKIEALNQKFDPNLHNAIMHVEDENYGENEVVEELLKGYKYKDTVVRYSMVKVAN